VLTEILVIYFLCVHNPVNDYLVKFHQIPSYITKIFLWHCIKYKAPKSGTIKVNIKNERDPSLFMSKLLLKFQNILRNTARYRRTITWGVFFRLFWNFISSLPVKRGGSLSFLTIFTFAVPELLDLIWRKIGFLPYVVW
jgi:hypothetical protein